MKIAAVANPAIKSTREICPWVEIVGTGVGALRVGDLLPNDGSRAPKVQGGVNGYLSDM